VGKICSYLAIVEKLILDGKHGPYAVAKSEKIGAVTFALDSSVWLEKCMPDEGICVMLSDLRKKRAGWRAMSARFQRPSDIQQSSIESTESPEQGE